MNRRDWLLAVAGAAAVAVSGRAFAAGTRPKVTVYKDPGCVCCTRWISHMKAAGFTVVAHDSTDMNSVKDGIGVPANMRSCHTAVTGRFWIEGHVPASDVIRLLDAPQASTKLTRGLAVPGMPMGSPGMEGPSPVAFDVMAVDLTGPRLWRHHGV